MIAIFPNQTVLNEIKPKLPSGVIIGTPLQSTDGRVAICHTFAEADQQEIIRTGGQLLETLPNDWRYPQDGIN